MGFGDIEVDGAEGKLYWVSSFGRTIQRSDLNGAGIQTIATFFRAPRKIPIAFPDRIESGVSDVGVGGTGYGPNGFF